MKLESLLKPAKILDEQILRQYTKITKKWEDRGHSRYSLAHAFNLTSIAALTLIVRLRPELRDHFLDIPSLFTHLTHL